MRYRIRLAGLPLAVYREVSAHLCQVDQVQTDLVSQQSQTFDYGTSQIDSLLIHYPEHAASQVYERVQQILAYYSDRYGAWEVTDLTQPGSEA